MPCLSTMPGHPNVVQLISCVAAAHDSTGPPVGSDISEDMEASKGK
jgi:hypothetical protein